MSLLQTYAILLGVIVGFEVIVFRLSIILSQFIRNRQGDARYHEMAVK